MIILRSVTTAVAALCMAVPLRGQGSSDRTEIVTSASGEVTLAPDRAVVRLEVASRAATAAQASSENQNRLAVLLDSLTAALAQGDSATVVGVSIQPNEDYDRRVIVDYEATAIVRVVVRDLNRLGALLDVALRAGATGLSDIDFLSDREGAARREALERAFAEAREQALTLAAAAGGQLGRLVRVSTVPLGAYPQFQGVSLDAITITGGVPLTAQDVVVRASVYAVWELARPSP